LNDDDDDINIMIENMTLTAQCRLCGSAALFYGRPAIPMRNAKQILNSPIP